METTASFGYWIHRQRKALDLTQQALADRVGCSLAAIKKIEGDERRPSRQIAERLAEVLGVPDNQRDLFMEVARGLRSVDQLSIAREPVSPSLPSGTVTFLFTDIEGSTKLWREHEKVMERSQARHHEILRGAIESNSGYIFQVIGDAFCAAFHKAGNALQAAVQAQTELTKEAWEEAVIKVRMGIHTGEAEIKDDGQYNGYLTMSRVQRLMSAGHGGQVLVSLISEEIIRDNPPPNVELRDLGEHRLKDLIRPKHIFQLVAPSLPSDFPPLKTLDAYPNNLPLQLTSFIGREKEIAEIKKEVKTHRLVTLTGSGGTGKTRLSLQVAADMLDAFPNGVWFVELAPLSDPDLIPNTVLSALGISEQQNKPALDVLQEYLQPRKLLLVLDNCEHLIANAATVANAILSAAPDVKILSSSREALGVQGELSWHVPSLSAPDPKKLPEIEALTQYEAVRLFIDRAILVSPHFTVTKDNAPAIAQICFRLDGIPLALELAAARVRLLSVDQISARLDDRFRLLTGGARTALPRQQTLRAMIDWSYDLLSEKERLLLRRLAVFAGGWTLELAEQICSDEKIDQYEILDMFGRLVDKSLVAVYESLTGTRYRILETVRQYAREKLFESGEGEKLRDKHLKVFMEFAEQTEPDTRNHNQAKSFARLEEEMDNFRLAMEWAHGRDNEFLLRLSTSLWRFLDVRSYQEDIEWLYTAIRLTEGMKTPARAYGLARAAWVFYNNKWTIDPFTAWVSEGLELSRALNCKPELAMMLCRQAVLDYLRNNSDDRSYLAIAQPVIEFSNDSNDHWALGFICIEVGGDLMAHDASAARQYLEEGLKHLEIAGDRRLLSWAYFIHLDVALRDGNASEALRFAEKAVEYAREIGDITSMGWGKLSIASIALFEDKYDDAEEFAREAYKYAFDSNDKRGVFFPLELLAKVDWSRGNRSSFLKYAEEALPWAKKLDDSFFRVDASYLLGTAFHVGGELSKARQKFREALDLSLQDQFRGSYRELYCGIFIQVGSVLIQEERAEQGVRLLGASDAIKRSAAYLYFFPYEMRELDAFIAKARAQLGDEAFDKAWAEGALMTTDEAVKYALEESSK
ncbi:MAG: adenylate/guanylate cyclase domain-containing protein [Anaerolineales bacterium]